MDKILTSINIVLSLYSLFLLFLVITLLRIKKHNAQGTNSAISIIVPFRNEAKNLPTLLTSLSLQDYKSKFELILVNDGSSDHFESVLEPFLESLSYSIKVVNSNFDSKIRLTGKQQALDTGVQNASFDWLAFTDADVKVGKNWLSSLAKEAENKRTIVFGHTSIEGEELPFIEKYSAFQLEFLFSAAYSFNKGGLHGSCMGNNLLISTQLYNEIGGQKGIGFTITEDMLLINKAIKIGALITPVNPFHPTVKTKAPSNLKELLHQSVRWAKGGMKGSLGIMTITMLTGFQATTSLFSPLGFFYEKLFLTTALTAINILLLFLFTSIFIRKTNAQCSLSFFPIFYITFALQSLFMPIPILFTKPKWKERKL